MEITLFDDEIRIIPSQGKSVSEKMERSYVRGMVERLLWAYKDTQITTWKHGIKFIGKRGE